MRGRPYLVAALLAVLAGLPARASGIGDGGPASRAVLSDPNDVAVDAEGNLFVADTGHNRVRRVDAATGTISTVAGNGTAEESGDGGPATSAGVIARGLFVDAAGDLSIAGAARVRKVDHASGIITTVAGGGDFSPEHGDGGPAVGAFLSPRDVVVDPIGNLFITDGSIPLPDAPYWDARVRKVDAITGRISTVRRAPDVTNPTFLSIDALGRVLVTNQSYHDCCTYSTIARGTAGGVHWSAIHQGGCPLCVSDPDDAKAAYLWWPLLDDLRGTAVDRLGTIYVAYGRGVGPGVSTVLTITGDQLIGRAAGAKTATGCEGDGGPGYEALLSSVRGLATHGGVLFIADAGNDNIRRVDLLAGTIDTAAGPPCP